MTAAPDLRLFDLLRVLREHRVDFIVIGGFAVAFHGHVRATKDVDIVPEGSAANLGRLWGALESIAARPGDLGGIRIDELPLPWSLESLVGGGGNWILETELGRVDVMQWVAGVDGYDDLRAGAEAAEIPEVGHTVLFAGFDDLIAMKQEAGRDQDLLDITALRVARGHEV